MEAYTETSKKLGEQESPVRFKCPGCLKNDITRSAHSRKIAAKYTCSCGFEGPN